MKYDYLIIGAGPAGLQLGYFFERSQRDYTILDASDRPGSFFQKFPRHGKLISINKQVTGFQDREMNMRWDWNSLINDSLFVTDYSRSYFPPAELMCTYLTDFQKHHRLKTRFNFRTKRVSKEKNEFRVLGECGTVLTCKRLIVATGLSKPHRPSFAGVELAEQYSDVSVDPEDFLGQRVLIVGKGNSALETADNLIETTASIHLCSPNPAKLAWSSHYVGNIRAVNNNFLDTYQLKSQNVVLDASIKSLERTQDGKIMCHIRYSHAKGELRSIPFDRVILATGFVFDDSIFESNCKPALEYDGKLPAMTAEWESQNVQGMYFAGTLMQARDYKKTMSGFIHGFRHNIKALNEILAEKHHATKWPTQKIVAKSDVLAQHVIGRLNRSAAMFLQPGFMGDLLLRNENEDWEYADDVPLQFVPDSSFAKAPCYYTVSLEYGDFSKVRDTFAVDRDPDPSKAHLIEYLHPIVRKYENGRLAEEHHLVEDLENDYQKKQFIESLRGFFGRELVEELAGSHS